MSERALITLPNGDRVTPAELEVLNRPPRHENPVAEGTYPNLDHIEDEEN